MPDDQPIPPPVVHAVPTDRLWFDPRVIMSACEVVFSDVAVPMGGVAPLIPPDPLRVAVGFSAPAAFMGNSFVGPWTDPDLHAFGVLTANATLWYWLHQYLNVVNMGWYINSTTPGFVRVTSVRRNT